MRRETGMLLALVLMCIALWTSNSDFLGSSNVVNTTRQISMLGIFAIGIAFVIITGGIDLSIGSVIGLTGVIIARLSSTETGGLGYPIWVGVTVALAVAVLVGLAQGLLITRLKLQPFIEINQNAYLHSARAFDGKPQRWRAYVSDFNGTISELLAKSVAQHGLDAPLGKEDGEILLEALQLWGALDKDYRYVEGDDTSDRRGYARAPGGGLSGKPVMSTTLLLDKEKLKDALPVIGVSADCSVADLSKSAKVHDLVQRDIDAVNTKLAKFERYAELHKSAHAYYASTATHFPKMALADTQPLIRPRMLPI